MLQSPGLKLTFLWGVNGPYFDFLPEGTVWVPPPLDKRLVYKCFPLLLFEYCEIGIRSDAEDRLMWVAGGSIMLVHSLEF